MNHKIGFALLGCGHIAQKHGAIIAEHLENAELVAVCDLDSQKAQAMGQKYNVPWFTNVHQMMDRRGEQIDAINILTPSGDHCQNTLEVAPYRKHLCVEKPMALTLEDASTMIDACNQARINLFVVAQNRFNIPVQKLRQAIQQGRFGKLVFGSARVYWCRPQSYYDSAQWRGTKALDGGVFANQAYHHLDLLQWLIGDIDTVSAKVTTRRAKIETEDTGVVLLKFSSGALGVIEATTAAPSDLEGSLSILGEEGRVEIAGKRLDRIRTWHFSNHQPEDTEILTQGCQNPPDVYGFAHQNYLRSMIRTLLEAEPTVIDGLAGQHSLELISAVYQSISTGKEVKMGSNYHRMPQNYRELGIPTSSEQGRKVASTVSTVLH